MLQRRDYTGMQQRQSNVADHDDIQSIMKSMRRLSNSSSATLNNESTYDDEQQCCETYDEYVAEKDDYTQQSYSVLCSYEQMLQ